MWSSSLRALRSGLGVLVVDSPMLPANAACGVV